MDKKVFHVASPVNMQNDQVLCPVQCQQAWNRCYMAATLSANFFQVADGFNCHLKAGLFGAVIYWTWHESGWQQILPVKRRVAGNVFVFQQDTAPAHRAHETVQLLQQQTPEFISLDLWPPNRPDLNPVHYRLHLVCFRMSSTTKKTSSGKCESKRVWKPRDDTLSIFCIKTDSFQSHPRLLEETCTHYFQCAVWETIAWWQANMHKNWSIQTILENFAYFCQMSSKLILIILSYTVSKSVHLRHGVVTY